MSRKRELLPLAATIIALAYGVLVLRAAPTVGLAFMFLAGIAIFIVAVRIVRPTTLTLDADGFTQRTPFRRAALVMTWQGSSAFSEVQVRAAYMIVYKTTQQHPTALRSARAALAGGDEKVRLGFGGLSGAELAQLMNRYREAELASRDTRTD
jgi:hypothetical protein